MLITDIAIIIAVAATAVSAYIAVSAGKRLKDSQQKYTTENINLQSEKEKAAIAETKLQEKEKALNEQQRANSQLQSNYESEKERRIKAEEKAQQQEIFIAERQKQNDEIIQTAATAARKSLAELSNKLLNDHKSETKEARQLSEKHIAEITNDLHKKFQSLTGQINEFGGRLQKQESGLASMHQIFSEPGKTGHAAEIILENKLKALGLTEGQDFLLQHSFHTTEGRLRPDAVVFLPDDYVIIIDSKASVAFSETQAEQDQLNRQIKTAMQNHIRSLGTKDYQSAVENGIRYHNRSFRPKGSITLMWLPSDGQVEKLRQADPNILYNASQKNILIVGPSALQAAITIASVKITERKQNQNQTRIIQEIDSLLQYIAIALKHAGAFSKAMRTSNKAYEQFAKSVNSRLLPKIHKIINLGINKPAQGNIDNQLPSLLGHSDIIEAEDENETQDLQITEQTTEKTGEKTDEL